MGGSSGPSGRKRLHRVSEERHVRVKRVTMWDAARGERGSARARGAAARPTRAWVFAFSRTRPTETRKTASSLRSSGRPRSRRRASRERRTLRRPCARHPWFTRACFRRGGVSESARDCERSPTVALSINTHSRERLGEFSAPEKRVRARCRDDWRSPGVTTARSMRRRSRGRVGRYAPGATRPSARVRVTHPTPPLGCSSSFRGLSCIFNTPVTPPNVFSRLKKWGEFLESSARDNRTICRTRRRNWRTRIFGENGLFGAAKSTARVPPRDAHVSFPHVARALRPVAQGAGERCLDHRLRKDALEPILRATKTEVVGEREGAFSRDASSGRARVRDLPRGSHAPARARHVQGPR